MGKQIKYLCIIVGIFGTIVIGAVTSKVAFLDKKENEKTPEELLTTYMNYIPKQEYEKMYAMLAGGGSEYISREDFIKRNSAIYEGIEIKNMKIDILTCDQEKKSVAYKTSFDTAAGNISFENKAYFLETEDDYKLLWEDSLIFPELCSTDKVKVSVIEARRGEILDRKGRVLAGKGVASSVGIIPGELEDTKAAVRELSKLLEIEPQIIEKKLTAKWIKEDSFVPIKTIPKVEEIELLSINPDKEMAKEKERQEKMLEIPGVVITDTKVRQYPLGEVAAHLTGYVKNVTAEDLEKHKGEDYTANSVIGSGGMEGLFEKELKGQNGCRIYIVDGDGIEKKELASVTVQHGKDVKLTIDANVQTILYEKFKEDKSCHVAMEPYTGEVLALVSTPSYNTNDFIMGLSNKQWKGINEDKNQPMYNRFRQLWCPGSTFKPIIVAIGLEAGKVNPLEDYGNVGLSWQKDTSGTELGWFAIFTTEKARKDPILLVSMVEDVKGRGGSGYVVEKEKQVLEKWFQGN